MKNTSLPLIISLDELDPAMFISYYLNNKESIEQKLLETGAIKFTGVHIDSLTDFQYVIDAISDRFLNYIDGNSPRTKLSGNVYTSTEYDNTDKITMHNELSYSAKWPNKLFFSCLQPANIGGETLLANSKDILINMDKAIVSAIANKGIMYIRNLHGGRGFGPSWQDTFETEDKTTVDKYCRDYQIEFEWHDGGNLKLVQRSKGIIEHRINKQKLWFNQIDQFHPCHLGEEILEAMLLMYDTPECFPTYVKFGDGTEIDESIVREILQTIDTLTLAPLWQKNELLIIDNELVCHGRNPFTGLRKVLVAMSE